MNFAYKFNKQKYILYVIIIVGYFFSFVKTLKTKLKFSVSDSALKGHEQTTNPPQIQNSTDASGNMPFYLTLCNYQQTLIECIFITFILPVKQFNHHL